MVDNPEYASVINSEVLLSPTDDKERVNDGDESSVSITFEEMKREFASVKSLHQKELIEEPEVKVVRRYDRDFFEKLAN